MRGQRLATFFLSPAGTLIVGGATEALIIYSLIASKQSAVYFWVLGGVNLLLIAGGIGLWWLARRRQRG